MIKLTFHVFVTFISEFLLLMPIFFCLIPNSSLGISQDVIFHVFIFEIFLGDLVLQSEFY